MNRLRLVAVATFSLIPAFASAGSYSKSATYPTTSDSAWTAAHDVLTDLKWKVKEEKKEDGLIVAKSRASALVIYGGVINISLQENGEQVKFVVTASAQQLVGDEKKLNGDLDNFFEKLDGRLKAGEKSEK